MHLSWWFWNAISRVLHHLYGKFSKLSAPIFKAIQSGGKSAGISEAVDQLQAPHNNFSKVLSDLSSKYDPESKWSSSVSKIAKALSSILPKVQGQARQDLTVAHQKLLEIASGGYGQYARVSYSIPAIRELMLTSTHPYGYKTKFDFNEFISAIGVFKPGKKSSPI